MVLSRRSGKETSLPEAIEGWEQYLHDGEGFLKTAEGACAKKKKAFTAEILYNLIAMAIEKFIMASLMSHGAMPCNHTMKDLVEAMDMTFTGAIDETRIDLLEMDRYQEICSLANFMIKPPGMKEIQGMLKTADKIKNLAVKLVQENVV